MGELRALNEAGAEKRKRAGELAALYLKEAKSLLESLRDDFSGEGTVSKALGGARLAALVSQVNEASAQYAAERYEAAIAVAKDAAVSAIEEIYRADARRQEWDNYHKTALTLAAETEAYLKAQETLTPEIKAEVERRSGVKLEDEIVGVKIGDYTGKEEEGLTPFGRLAAAVSERKRELEEAEPSSMSVTRMKEIASDLNTKLYPAAMTVVYEGIINMNNAFTRQRLSEEIVDFFEEHNFTFSGYRYDGDRHDGALYIGLENGVTGEEIVVTLAPETMGAGDVQTRVSIDQLKGDGRNEERKEYYRQAVREVVAEGLPGAALGLSCDESTRNRLSSNTQLRDKLKK